MYACESTIMQQFVASIELELSGKTKEREQPIVVDLKDILQIYPSIGIIELAEYTNSFLALCPRKLPTFFTYRDLINKFQLFDTVCKHVGFD